MNKTTENNDLQTRLQSWIPISKKVADESKGRRGRSEAKIQDLISAAAAYEKPLSKEEILTIVDAEGEGFKLNSPSWIASKQTQLRKFPANSQAPQAVKLRKLIASAMRDPRLNGLKVIKTAIDEDSQASYDMYDTQLFCIASMKGDERSALCKGLGYSQFRKEHPSYLFLLTFDDVLNAIIWISDNYQLVADSLPNFEGKSIFDRSKSKKEKGNEKVTLPTLLIPNNSLILPEGGIKPSSDESVQLLILLLARLADAKKVYRFYRKENRSTYRGQMFVLLNKILDPQPKLAENIDESTIFSIARKLCNRWTKIDSFYKESEKVIIPKSVKEKVPTQPQVSPFREIAEFVLVNQPPNRVANARQAISRLGEAFSPIMLMSYIDGLPTEGHELAMYDIVKWSAKGIPSINLRKEFQAKAMEIRGEIDQRKISITRFFDLFFTLLHPGRYYMAVNLGEVRQLLSYAPDTDILGEKIIQLFRGDPVISPDSGFFIIGAAEVTATAVTSLAIFRPNDLSKKPIAGDALLPDSIIREGKKKIGKETSKKNNSSIRPQQTNLQGPQVKVKETKQKNVWVDSNI